MNNYMLLSRLQQDCEFYLNFGQKNPKNLWANTEIEHILEMKKIWNNLSEKPEWLTLEKIEFYESQMINKATKNEKFKR